MTTRSHEQTINTALGEVLQSLGRRWTVRSEEIGNIIEGGGRPDLLIERADGWPIVVEAEVGNHAQAEIEARSRLGKRLISSTHSIDTAFALVYPDELRSHRGGELRNAIQEASLAYALLSTGADGRTVRFPSYGWLSGGVVELALLIHRSSVPAWKVEGLADAPN